MIICKESSELYIQWSSIAQAFLQLGIGLAQARQDPEYQAAYLAYFNHNQTCPICRDSLRAEMQRFAMLPVAPVPEGI